MILRIREEMASEKSGAIFNSGLKKGRKSFPITRKIGGGAGNRTRVLWCKDRASTGVVR